MFPACLAGAAAGAIDWVAVGTALDPVVAPADGPAGTACWDDAGGSTTGGREARIQDSHNKKIEAAKTRASTVRRVSISKPFQKKQSNKLNSGVLGVRRLGWRNRIIARATPRTTTTQPTNRHTTTGKQAMLFNCLVRVIRTRRQKSATRAQHNSNAELVTTDQPLCQQDAHSMQLSKLTQADFPSLSVSLSKVSTSSFLIFCFASGLFRSKGPLTRTKRSTEWPAKD